MKAKFFIALTATLMVVYTTGCFASKSTVASEALNLGHMEYYQDNDLAEASLNLQRPPQYGHDSIGCLRAISLYTEWYNQRNYNMAYQFWREAYTLCPQSSLNIFIRGAILLKHKYNEELDPLKRELYVDSLMMLYDKRIEFFGREGFVTGRKAAELFSFRQNAVQEIYDLSEKSIQMEGRASLADVLMINMQMATSLVAAGLMDAEAVVMKYDRAMTIIEDNIARSNTPDNYETAKTAVDGMFEPFASCDNIVKVFRPRFDSSPKDADLLSKITALLSRAGCTDDKLFYESARNLHEIRPSAQSAFNMGRMENNNRRYTEALRYFQQAVDLYESPDDKFTALMLMADITFRQLRQNQQARAHALRAAEMKANDGRPFLLIGEMYATSANACGDNELTNKVAYWAAVDKFQQARNIDSDQNVKDRANQLIAAYSQYFPGVETIFFHGLSEGDTYRVECWINETTRVRAR